MDLPPSPEKELSPQNIPDLNVKSYYGEHLAAVQDDFGAYSYSDSSTSPETFNGGVSISEDSLDNQLIPSGLPEEEVPIIESSTVYNDSLCDVSNSKGFIDDILVNLGSSASRASGDAGNKTEVELDKDDDSCSLSSGESRCSCDACFDSCRESRSSSPLALSDDSSFASSCDSFDYPFLQTNSEYLDTQLTLSSPEHPFSIQQLYIKFPNMNSNMYIFDTEKALWKVKGAVVLRLNNVIMSAKDLSYHRESSKVFLREFPEDIIFPQTSLSDSTENTQGNISNSNPGGSNGNIPLLGLITPAGAPPQNPDSNQNFNETVAEDNSISKNSPKTTNATSSPPKPQCSSNELADALKKLASVKYSLESTSSEYASTSFPGVTSQQKSEPAHSSSKSENNTSARKVNLDCTFDTKTASGKGRDTENNNEDSNVQDSLAKDVIMVGRNVITCINPAPFTESYSSKNYEDNCLLKDSNPNSVEDCKNHTEDSLDDGSGPTSLLSPEPLHSKENVKLSTSQNHLNQDVLDNITKHAKIKSQDVRNKKPHGPVKPQNQEIESDVINDAALLYRLANSFESFNNCKTQTNTNSTISCNSAALDMPSLSPAPDINPNNQDLTVDNVSTVPPTLMPQTVLTESKIQDDLHKSSKFFEMDTVSKKQRHERKQDKQKINHMLPKHEVNKLLYNEVTHLSTDVKSRVPELVDFDLSNCDISANESALKSVNQNSIVTGEPNKKTIISSKIANEIKNTDIIKFNVVEKKTIFDLVDVKKSEKKSQSVPKSFILGKVFPKNRVTKPEKTDSFENKSIMLMKPEDSESMVKSDSTNVEQLLPLCNNHQFVKQKDKDRIVVSLVGDNNVAASNQVKNKIDRSNAKKITSAVPSKKLVKAPSFCNSSRHKLVVFKKNALFLDKLAKKQVVDQSNRDNDIKSSNGHSDMINQETKNSSSQKENLATRIQDLPADGTSSTLKKSLSSLSVVKFDEGITTKSSVVTSTPICKSYIAPDNTVKDRTRCDKSADRLHDSSEKGADKETSCYTKNKAQVVRQKIDSVVAEADSTGSDASEFILDKGANLIIQNDSSCNRTMPVSNEIRLKQSDSVRLLLDPGSHSREPNRYSMVITVATAGISCINELDPTCSKEPVKGPVSAKATRMEVYNQSDKHVSDKKNNQNDSRENKLNNNINSSMKLGSESLSLNSVESVSNSKSEKKLKPAGETCIPVDSDNGHGGSDRICDKPNKVEIVSRSSGSKSKNIESESLRRRLSSSDLKNLCNKYTDSVSSTSCVEPCSGKTKSTLSNLDKKPADKNIKKPSSGSDGNKKDASKKLDKDTSQESSNIRKRSASCGSAVKQERRHSSETGNTKKSVEILCSIELDSIKNSIKSKSLSLSDTCVSSLCDKDSEKREGDSSTGKAIKDRSSTLSIRERNDNLEVSSSTSPGKDDKDGGRLDELILPAVGVSLMGAESSEISKRNGEPDKPVKEDFIFSKNNGSDSIVDISSHLTSHVSAADTILTKISDEMSEDEHAMYRNPDNPCIVKTDCLTESKVKGLIKGKSKNTKHENKSDKRTEQSFSDILDDSSKRKKKNNSDSDLQVELKNSNLPLSRLTKSNSQESVDSVKLDKTEIPSNKTSQKIIKEESSALAKSRESKSSSKVSSNCKAPSSAKVKDDSLPTNKTKVICTSKEKNDKSNSSRSSKTSPERKKPSVNSATKTMVRSASHSSLEKTNKSQSRQKSKVIVNDTVPAKVNDKVSKNNEIISDQLSLRTRSLSREVPKENDKSKVLVENVLNKDKISFSESKLFDKSANNASVNHQSKVVSKESTPKIPPLQNKSQDKNSGKESKTDVVKLSNNESDSSSTSKDKSKSLRDTRSRKGSECSSSVGMTKETSVTITGAIKLINQSRSGSSENKKGKEKHANKNELGKNKTSKMPSVRDKRYWKIVDDSLPILATDIEKNSSTDSNSKNVSEISSKEKIKTDQLEPRSCKKVSSYEDSNSDTSLNYENEVSTNLDKTSLRSRTRLQQDSVEAEKIKLMKFKTKAALKEFVQVTENKGSNKDTIVKDGSVSKKSNISTVDEKELKDVKSSINANPSTKSNSKNKQFSKQNENHTEELVDIPPNKRNKVDSKDHKMNDGKSAITNEKPSAEKSKIKSDKPGANKEAKSSLYAEQSYAVDERMTLRNHKGFKEDTNKVKDKEKITVSDKQSDNIIETSKTKLLVDSSYKNLSVDSKDKDNGVRPSRKLTSSLEFEEPASKNATKTDSKCDNLAINNSAGSNDRKKDLVNSNKLITDLRQMDVVSNSKDIVSLTKKSSCGDISQGLINKIASHQGRARSRSSPPPNCEIQVSDMVNFMSKSNSGSKDLKCASNDSLRSPPSLTDRKLRSSSANWSSNSSVNVESNKTFSSLHTINDKNKINEKLGDKIITRSKSNSESSDASCKNNVTDILSDASLRPNDSSQTKNDKTKPLKTNNDVKLSKLNNEKFAISSVSDVGISTDVSDIPLPSGPPIPRRSSSRLNKFEELTTVAQDMKIDVSEIPLPKSPPSSRRSLRYQGKSLGQSNQESSATFSNVKSPTERKIAYKNIGNEPFTKFETNVSLRSFKEMPILKDFSKSYISSSAKTTFKDIFNSKDVTPKSPVNSITSPIKDSLVSKLNPVKPDSKDVISAENISNERRSSLRLQGRLSSPTSSYKVSEETHSNIGNAICKPSNTDQDKNSVISSDQGITNENSVDNELSKSDSLKTLYEFSETSDKLSVPSKPDSKLITKESFDLTSDKESKEQQDLTVAFSTSPASSRSRTRKVCSTSNLLGSKLGASKNESPLGEEKEKSRNKQIITLENAVTIASAAVNDNINANQITPNKSAQLTSIVSINKIDDDKSSSVVRRSSRRSHIKETVSTAVISNEKTEFAERKIKYQDKLCYTVEDKPKIIITDSKVSQIPEKESKITQTPGMEYFEQAASEFYHYEEIRKSGNAYYNASSLKVKTSQMPQQDSKLTRVLMKDSDSTKYIPEHLPSSSSKRTNSKTSKKHESVRVKSTLSVNSKITQIPEKDSKNIQTLITKLSRPESEDKNNRKYMNKEKVIFVDSGKTSSSQISNQPESEIHEARLKNTKYLNSPRNSLLGAVKEMLNENDVTRELTPALNTATSKDKTYFLNPPCFESSAADISSDKFSPVCEKVVTNEIEISKNGIHSKKRKAEFSLKKSKTCFTDEFEKRKEVLKETKDVDVSSAIDKHDVSTVNSIPSSSSRKFDNNKTDFKTSSVSNQMDFNIFAASEIKSATSTISEDIVVDKSGVSNSTVLLEKESNMSEPSTIERESLKDNTNKSSNLDLTELNTDHNNIFIESKSTPSILLCAFSGSVHAPDYIPGTTCEDQVKMVTNSAYDSSDSEAKINEIACNLLNDDVLSTSDISECDDKLNSTLKNHNNIGVFEIPQIPMSDIDNSTTMSIHSSEIANISLATLVSKNRLPCYESNLDKEVVSAHLHNVDLNQSSALSSMNAATSPLYEAIIANTCDYALVSPVSDTVVVSGDSSIIPSEESFSDPHYQTEAKDSLNAAATMIYEVHLKNLSKNAALNIEVSKSAGKEIKNTIEDHLTDHFKNSVESSYSSVADTFRHPFSGSSRKSLVNKINEPTYSDSVLQIPEEITKFATDILNSTEISVSKVLTDKVASGDCSYNIKSPKNLMLDSTLLQLNSNEAEIIASVEPSDKNDTDESVLFNRASTSESCRVSEQSVNVNQSGSHIKEPESNKLVTREPPADADIQNSTCDKVFDSLEIPIRPPNVESAVISSDVGPTNTATNVIKSSDSVNGSDIINHSLSDNNIIAKFSDADAANSAEYSSTTTDVVTDPSTHDLHAVKESTPTEPNSTSPLLNDISSQDESIASSDVKLVAVFNKEFSNSDKLAGDYNPGKIDDKFNSSPTDHDSPLDSALNLTETSSNISGETPSTFVPLPPSNTDSSTCNAIDGLVNLDNSLLETNTQIDTPECRLSDGHVAKKAPNADLGNSEDIDKLGYYVDNNSTYIVNIQLSSSEDSLKNPIVPNNSDITFGQCCPANDLSNNAASSLVLNSNTTSLNDHSVNKVEAVCQDSILESNDLTVEIIPVPNLNPPDNIVQNDNGEEVVISENANCKKDSIEVELLSNQTTDFGLNDLAELAVNSDSCPASYDQINMNSDLPNSLNNFSNEVPVDNNSEGVTASNSSNVLPTSNDCVQNSTIAVPLVDPNDTLENLTNQEFVSKINEEESQSEANNMLDSSPAMSPEQSFHSDLNSANNEMNGNVLDNLSSLMSIDSSLDPVINIDGSVGESHTTVDSLINTSMNSIDENITDSLNDKIELDVSNNGVDISTDGVSSNSEDVFVDPNYSIDESDIPSDLVVVDFVINSEFSQNDFDANFNKSSSDESAPTHSTDPEINDCKELNVSQTDVSCTSDPLNKNSVDNNFGHLEKAEMVNVFESSTNELPILTGNKTVDSEVVGGMSKDLLYRPAVEEPFHQSPVNVNSLLIDKSDQELEVSNNLTDAHLNEDISILGKDNCDKCKDEIENSIDNNEAPIKSKEYVVELINLNTDQPKNEIDKSGELNVEQDLIMDNPVNEINKNNIETPLKLDLDDVNSIKLNKDVSSDELDHSEVVVENRVYSNQETNSIVDEAENSINLIDQSDKCKHEINNDSYQLNEVVNNKIDSVKENISSVSNILLSNRIDDKLLEQTEKDSVVKGSFVHQSVESKVDDLVTCEQLDKHIAADKVASSKAGADVMTLQVDLDDADLTVNQAGDSINNKESHVQLPDKQTELDVSISDNINQSNLQSRVGEINVCNTGVLDQSNEIILDSARESSETESTDNVELNLSEVKDNGLLYDQKKSNDFDHPTIKATDKAVNSDILKLSSHVNLQDNMNPTEESKIKFQVSSEQMSADDLDKSNNTRYSDDNYGSKLIETDKVSLSHNLQSIGDTNLHISNNMTPTCNSKTELSHIGECIVVSSCKNENINTSDNIVISQTNTVDAANKSTVDKVESYSSENISAEDNISISQKITADATNDVIDKEKSFSSENISCSSGMNTVDDVKDPAEVFINSVDVSENTEQSVEEETIFTSNTVGSDKTSSNNLSDHKVENVNCASSTAADERKASQTIPDSVDQKDVRASNTLNLPNSPSTISVHSDKLSNEMNPLLESKSEFIPNSSQPETFGIAEILTPQSNSSDSLEDTSEVAAIKVHTEDRTAETHSVKLVAMDDVNVNDSEAKLDLASTSLSQSGSKICGAQTKVLFADGIVANNSPISEVINPSLSGKETEISDNKIDSDKDSDNLEKSSTKFQSSNVSNSVDSNDIEEHHNDDTVIPCAETIMPELNISVSSQKSEQLDVEAISDKDNSDKTTIADTELAKVEDTTDRVQQSSDNLEKSNTCDETLESENQNDRKNEPNSAESLFKKLPNTSSSDLVTKAEENRVVSENSCGQTLTSQKVRDSFDDNSPETASTPSPALVISPLSVTIYNSSDDTDASPANQPGPNHSHNVISVPSMTISGPTVFESHLDVTVVNPTEDSSDKTSQIDIVVVSPSGNAMPSPVDSKITKMAYSDNLSFKAISDSTDVTTETNKNPVKVTQNQKKSANQRTERVLCSSRSPRGGKLNVSTEEEILNELMSSVVKSGVEVSDTSESEPSPKSVCCENTHGPWGGIKLLSPDSLESANYKKRKIKALRETDFVKKRKHFHNSGNIIIHNSSEDEQINSPAYSPINSVNSPKKVLETPVTPKFANPYSKIFYYKRNRSKNSKEADFSFKSLFCSRKRSNKKVVKNEELDSSADKHELEDVQQSSRSLASAESTFVKPQCYKSVENTCNVPPTEKVGGVSEPSLTSIVNNTDTKNVKKLSNKCNIKSVTNTSCFSIDDKTEKTKQVLPTEESNPSSNMKTRFSTEKIVKTVGRLDRTFSLSCPKLNCLTTGVSNVRLSRVRSKSLDLSKNQEYKLSKSDFTNTLGKDRSLLPAEEHETAENSKEEVKPKELKLTSTTPIKENDLVKPLPKPPPLKELRVLLERIDLSQYLNENNEFKVTEDITKNTRKTRFKLKRSPINDVDVQSRSRSMFTSYLRNNPGSSSISSKVRAIRSERHNNSVEHQFSYSDNYTKRLAKNAGDAQDLKPGTKGNESARNICLVGNSHLAEVSRNKSSDFTVRKYPVRRNSENPSRSRPASPNNIKDLGSGIPVIKLQRLTINNIRSVLRADSVTTATVPRYFLHLRDGVSRVKRFFNRKTHYIELIDRGPYLKVISVQQKFEMFYLDIEKDQIYHPHMGLDSCLCPFNRRLSHKFFRGWKYIEEELRKEKEKRLQALKKHAVAKSPPKPSMKKCRSPFKPKTAEKYIRVNNNAMNQAAVPEESNDMYSSSSQSVPKQSSASLKTVHNTLEKMVKRANRIPGIINEPSRVTKQVKKFAIGRVKGLPLPPQESSLSNPFNMVTGASTESSRPDETSNHFLVPPEGPQEELPESTEMVEFDIFSVKGMIKERKGSSSRVRDYDSLSFGGLSEDLESESFECEEFIVADSLITPRHIGETVSDDIDYFPMNNYNSFMRQRLDESEMESDFTQTFNVNNYLKEQSENNLKKNAMSTHRKMEVAFRLNKRKSDEPNSSSDKRPRFENERNVDAHLRLPMTSSQVKLLENSVRMLDSQPGGDSRLPDKSLDTRKDNLSSLGNQISKPKRTPCDKSLISSQSRNRTTKRVSRRREHMMRQRDEHQTTKTAQNQNPIPGYRFMSETKVIGVSINQEPSLVQPSVTLRMLQSVQGHKNRMLSIVSEEVAGKSSEPVTVSHVETEQLLLPVWVRKKTLEEKRGIVTSLSRINKLQNIFPISTTASSYKTDQNLNKAVKEIKESKNSTDDYDYTLTPRIMSLHNWKQCFPKLKVFDPSSVDRESNSDSDESENSSEPNSATSVPEQF